MIIYPKKGPAVIFGLLQLISPEPEEIWRIGPLASPGSSRDRSLLSASTIQVLEVCKPGNLQRRLML